MGYARCEVMSWLLEGHQTFAAWMVSYLVFQFLGTEWHRQHRMAPFAPGGELRLPSGKHTKTIENGHL